MSGRKVRTKKLGVKTPLPVLRESEIDQSEYHALVSENQIATGVEHAEENVSWLDDTKPDRSLASFRRWFVARGTANPS